MKRYAFYMLIMAVAAVTACQKQSVLEDPVSPEPEASQKTTYTYTVGASIDTQEVKSDYDADGKFSWSENDAISVLFHKDATNQFFTLNRISGTGKTATFSGEITEGFTIGASDGTVEDKKILAFYPASTSHTYTVGGDPKFYTPAVNDLSSGNFSANIPMYDKLTAEGDFTFKNMTCAYKITVTDLDVSKIRVDVHNDENYYLSGLTTMSGSNYLRYDGSSKDISYICDVDGDKKAVFYISCRYGGDKHFKPTITIKDYSTGLVIKEVTAANAVNIPDPKVKRLTISAPGAGSPIYSSYKINWTTITTSAAGRSDSPYDGICMLKATSDASNLYLFFEVAKTSTYSETGYTHENLLYIYLGDSSSETAHSWQWTNNYTVKFEGWLLQSGVPNYVTYASGAVVGSTSVAYGDSYFYEIAIPRTYNTCLAGTSATVSIEANQQYVESGTWKGSNTQIGFAPTTGGTALTVSMTALP